MNKRQYTWQIIKLFFSRSIEPTRGEKLLLILLLFCAVGFGTAGFATLINPFAFGWLVYVSQAAILVVGVAAIIWHVWTIIKHLETNEHKE